MDPIIRDYIIVRFFQYMPCRPPAIAALVVYLVLALLTTVLTLKTRARFTAFIPVTAFCEMLGYVTRLVFLHNPALGTYVAMSFFLIITPTLLAIVDYVMVGQLIAMSSVPGVGPFKANQISKFFAMSDCLTLTIQFSAGGLLGSGDMHLAELGEKVMLTGLILQLIFFACFTVITLHIHIDDKYSLRHRPSASLVFLSLYLSIGLLTTRNIYRVIEFAQGFTGYLAVHEVYFYFFDSLLVALAITTLTLLHPGYLLPKVAMAKGLGAAKDKTIALVAVNPYGGDVEPPQPSLLLPDDAAIV